ncbi:MAG: sugar phosphate isomerase/epimerase family protein [Anaerolineae bacterium]
MLSMATDYSPNIHRFESMADMEAGIGNPQPFLKAIADAGFSHVHWCHHWSGDFIYGESEMTYIGNLLRKYNLIVADLHGSEGREKFWYSPQEYARQAGVELVKNRIDFCARFGGDSVVMHAYPLKNENEWDQLRRTLDDLMPYALKRGIKIAIENLIDFRGVHFDKVPVEDSDDNWGLIQRIFDEYPADFVGLCYDSGHAHLGRDRSAGLKPFLDRLLVLHLHGNDGNNDQHRNMFVNDLDWDNLAKMIASSPYRKPMSLEVMASELDENEDAFLATAFATGNRFSEMVDRHRNS